MAVRVVSMALAIALTAAAGSGAADEPARAPVTAVTTGTAPPTVPLAAAPRPTVGSVPWVASVDRPSAAWVLQVPLKLSWPPPAWSRTALGARRVLAFEDYPDPRRAPVQTFHLELRQDQDLSFLGVPLTSRIASYQPVIAPQTATPSMQPLWTGDAAVRLPRNLYGGASVLQRIDGQRAVFLVTGQRF